MKDRIERTQWMVGAVVGEKLEKGKVFCSVMLLTHMLRWYCCGAHSMYGMCVVVIVHQVSSRWRSQNGDVGTLGLSYCTVRNEEDGKNNKKIDYKKKNTMTMCEDDYVQRRWIERSATSMVLTASERRTTGRRQWDVMGLNHNNQNRWIRHKIKFCWQATGGSQKYK